MGLLPIRHVLLLVPGEVQLNAVESIRSFALMPLTRLLDLSMGSPRVLFAAQPIAADQGAASHERG